MNKFKKKFKRKMTNNSGHKRLKPLQVKEIVHGYRTLSVLPELKRHQFEIEKNTGVTGDAPKDILRVYRYTKKSKIRKRNPSTWARYIAKLGHKYYPIESITEQLMTRIGQCFKFNMANSILAKFSGQLRFMSEIFLPINQSLALIHGAELYARYLEDSDFVEKIEVQNCSAEFFSVQFTENVFYSVFPEHADCLFNEYLTVLLFDALIGNNDRHFYNWGIISNVETDAVIGFAPIYDSARGLFWHETEEKLSHISKNETQKENFIKKYANNSYPKTGIEGFSKINHFDFIKEINWLYPQNSFGNYINDKYLFQAQRMIIDEFAGLMTNTRQSFIIDLLQYRFEKIKNILNMK
jgi:hypothetical protein